MKVRLLSLPYARETGGLWGFQFLGVRFTLWREACGLSLFIFR
jgi:hypothetical protein